MKPDQLNDPPQFDTSLYVKQDHFKTLPQVDAVLLDVDGVVLDVSESYRVVISQTVQFYATNVMNLQDTGTLLQLEEIELFKLAGGFNSDWDLANAAVALVIAKHAQSGAEDTSTLREQEPGWAEFVAESKRRGGGPQGVEAFILERLTPRQRRDFANGWKPDLVTQMFQEMYAGDDMCRQLYGFDPQHIHGEGLYKNETVLLDAALLPPQVKVGVLTGRNQTETQLAMRIARLAIPSSAWQTADDGPLKPDGRALVHLRDKVDFRYGVYIGDTMDDLLVVQNYREQKGSGRAKILSCIVLSGPAGDKHRRLFLEAGADIIAPDANTFLQYLNTVKKRGTNR